MVGSHTSTYVATDPRPAIRLGYRILFVHDRHGELAWLPVTRLGELAIGFLFGRPDPFPPDAASVLACAQEPVAAIERLLHRRRPRPPTDVPAACALTARELQVLALLGRGLLARTIATQLSLSPRTVHHHLGQIYDKLGVRDRLAAVLLARDVGLLDVATVRSQDTSAGAGAGRL
jgi:DNA-binding CsgD family transcriptional regulator